MRDVKYIDKINYIKKKDYLSFYNDTYEFNLYVFIGDIKIFKKYTNNPKCLSNDTIGATYNYDNGSIAIWIPNKRTSNVTIAHEALHAVNYVFLYKGIEYNLKNDEPQAYLLSWFIKAIYTAIKNKPQ